MRKRILSWVKKQWKVLEGPLMATLAGLLLWWFLVIVIADFFDLLPIR